MTEYVHVGAHAFPLSSGRWIGPGDHVDADEITRNDELHDHEQHRVDIGVLVDVASFDESGPSNQEQLESSDSEIPDLHTLARGLDIRGRSKMTDEELRAAVDAALEAKENADAS